MKIRNVVFLTLFLIVLDQAVKLIIIAYYFDVTFPIIPSLLDFRPKFNDKHSYVNVLLNQYLGVHVGLLPHIILFIAIQFVMILLFGYFRKNIKNNRILGVAFAFQMSAMACAMLGNLVWKQGTLDFIYLIPFFIFDLKDLYSNCFILLFFIYVNSVKKALDKVHLSDVIIYAKEQFCK